MKMKKSILIIMTFILIILPMMTITTKAVSVGTINNLQAQTKGNVVYFTWNTVSGVDGYDIYINTANKGYEYIGSVEEPVAPVIGFKEGVSYIAKVCAYQMQSNGSKLQGSFSSEVPVNPELQIATLEKVTGLIAKQNGNNVTLNWNQVNQATGYQVFVDIPGWGYVNIGEVEGISHATITGCEIGKTYGFKIRAYKKLASGAMEYSKEFSNEQRLTLKTNKPDNESIKPEKVTNLTVSNITQTTANISWQKAQNADGYEIYLAKQNGRFEYKQTVYNNSAVISNLEDNTTYGVKVVSIRTQNNNTIAGEESDAKWFTTNKKKIEVGTATNLRIEVDGNKAYLDWTKANNADGYEIYMKTGNGRYEYKNTVYKNSATISNLNYDTTYHTIVVAFRQVNGRREYGADSQAIRFITDDNIIIPAQVKGVTAKPSNNSVTINWSKATDADGYEVFLSKNNTSNFQYRGSTTARSITLNNLEYDTKYYVRVVAYHYHNGSRKYGKDSTSVRFTTEQNKPSQVKNVTTSVSKNKITVDWSSVNNADGYNIYVSKNNSSNFKLYGSVTGRKAIISNLDYNTTYYIKVCAYQKMNGRQEEGTASTSKRVTTAKNTTTSQTNTQTSSKVPQVKGLKATVKKDTVKLTWNTVSGAVYYEIDYTIPGYGASGNFKLTSYTNSYEIEGLTEKGYSYTARVRAYKWVNGKLVPGTYSTTTRFTAK